MTGAASFSFASPGRGGLLAVAVATAAWGGCGGGDGPSSPEWDPNDAVSVIELVGTLPATVPPGRSVEVTVRALGGAGLDPVAGATVRFTPAQGSGSASPAAATTDGQGYSRTQWTVGTQGGPQTLTASVGTASATASVQVLPVSVELAGSLPATVLSGDVVEVTVRARAGPDPVAGVTVRFAPAQGSGSASPPAATTDGQGIARTLWTVGTQGGTQTMTASVGAESVTAAVRVREVRISLASGAGQWAVVGAKLPNPVEISVADESGRPLVGIEIVFEGASQGHGSASPASVKTDGQGLARTAWTLGDIWGTQRLRARVRDSSLQVVVEAESYSQDRKPLEDLYNATGGPSWENRENWMAEGVRIDRWYGVTTDRAGRVVALHLRVNNLAGSIPSSLGNLTNLQRLDFTQNDLTGPIPSELGNLTDLRTLYLNSNDLTGPVPSELGKLTRLVHLDLGWNWRLTVGPIPGWLANLTNMESLDLAGNNRTGPIPSELGNLANLEYLNLQANDLTGPIPSELGNLANLRTIWACNNNLTGPFPSWLRNLRGLRSLCLSRNDLTPGPIPGWLGDLPLWDLIVSSSNRTGPIPSELGNLDLWRLKLDDNNLTGPIPSELGNITNLRQLEVHNNANLTGPLPLSLTNLGSLELLYFNDTDLCVPNNASFAAWLQAVNDVSGTNRKCP